MEAPSEPSWNNRSLQHNVHGPVDMNHHADTLVDHGDGRDNHLSPSTTTTTTTTPTTARAWWQGNWSPLWVMGTTYLVLFVAYLGLAEMGHKPAAFVLHTLFALTFVLACAANLFHTPSHGATYRTMHRWLGWTAIWSGFAVVVSGYYMVFRKNYPTTLSTAAQNVFVGTGALQVVLQCTMIYMIRYAKSVWYHMVCACVLFYASALMPALNRAPQILHFPDSDVFTFAIMPLGVVLVYFAIATYAKQILSTKAQSQAQSQAAQSESQASVVEQ